MPLYVAVKRVQFVLKLWVQEEDCVRLQGFELCLPHHIRVRGKLVQSLSAWELLVWMIPFFELVGGISPNLHTFLRQD